MIKWLAVAMSTHNEGVESLAMMSVSVCVRNGAAGCNGTHASSLVELKFSRIET